MTTKKEKKEGCMTSALKKGCCRVESLIAVDDRGQTVLPKEIREKAKIRAGDKLALMTWEKDGEVCCITLVKVEQLTDIVKGMLGPVMKDLL
ncbi:MAG: HgcAB-associated protein HgcC [Syntrophales bacterium]